MGTITFLLKYSVLKMTLDTFNTTVFTIQLITENQIV